VGKILFVLPNSVSDDVIHVGISGLHITKIERWRCCIFDYREITKGKAEQWIVIVDVTNIERDCN
jgi:hypothetical protein